MFIMTIAELERYISSTEELIAYLIELNKNRLVAMNLSKRSHFLTIDI